MTTIFMGLLTNTLGEVLLGTHAGGPFEGRWMCPYVVRNQMPDAPSPADQLIASIRDQTELRVFGLEPRGAIVYTFDDAPKRNVEIRLFTSQKHRGTAKPCKAFGPLRWFSQMNLPEEMPLGSGLWLPSVAFQDRDRWMRVRCKGYAFLGEERLTPFNIGYPPLIQPAEPER